MAAAETLCNVYELYERYIIELYNIYQNGTLLRPHPRDHRIAAQFCKKKKSFHDHELVPQVIYFTMTRILSPI